MATQGTQSGAVGQEAVSVVDNVAPQVSALQQQVQQQNDAIQALKERVAEQQGLLEAYSAAHDSVFRTIEMGYSNTLTWYTVVLALAGLVGLLLIGGYKKREIAKVADDARDLVKEKFDDPEVMATYLAGAMETEKYQETLSRLKNELFEELRDDLRDWFEDSYSSTLKEGESQRIVKEKFQEAIGESDSDRTS